MACERCSLLRIDPAQRPRLILIRDSLAARITEAKEHGWLGELEGLQVSLAMVKEKLQALDARTARHPTVTDLGMPTFTRIAGRDDRNLALAASSFTHASGQRPPRPETMIIS
jgi:hypothetical protein